MATSPADIVEAIDAAILAMIAGGAAQSISFGDGRSMTFHNLDSLRTARREYAAIADSNAPNTLRISSLKYGRPI